MKKIRFLFFLTLLLMTAVGAKAGGLVVTSNDIGKVICTDRSVYASRSLALAEEKNPVAMIAYVDMEQNRGLAISLSDAEWETRWYSAESCADEWNFNADKAVAGCFWKLPTAKEWQQMLIGCGAEGTVSDNPLGVSLSLQIDTLLPNHGLSDNVYWTATEDSNSGYTEAWTANFGSDKMNLLTSNNSNYLKVRPCLLFDVEPPHDITAATTEDIGKIVGTDGKIYKDRDDLPDGVDAVAMLAYVDTENHTGLAIALEDVSSQKLVAQQGGMAQWIPVSTFMWEFAKSHAEGYTPLVPNGTWKLPSVGDFKNMLGGCGDEQLDNTSTMTWNHLNSKLSAINGSPFQSSDGSMYWLENTNGSNNAWSVEFLIEGNSDQYYNAYFSGSTSKTNDYKLRACLTFNLVSTVPASDGIVVTSDDIGKVLCTDGSIFASVNEAEAKNKIPVAMIAYIGTNAGLAVALEDAEADQWYYAESSAKAWNTNENKAIAGGVWKLPTIQEWQQMLIGCGADGSVLDSPSDQDVLSITGINSKLDAVQKVQINSTLCAYYWSASTNYAGSANVVDCDNLEGTMRFTTVNKGDNWVNTRLCLAFGVVTPKPARDITAATTKDIGKIVGTDGKIYKDRDNMPDGVNAAAMLAYVDKKNHKGLAIALADVSAQYLRAQQGGMAQWISASTFKYEFVKSYAEGYTPLVPNGTWKLPSVDEFKNMLFGCGDVVYGNNNNFVTCVQMESKLEAIGGASLRYSNNSYNYWLEDENGNSDAWAAYYNYQGGYYEFSSSTNKNEELKARACLTFDLVSTVSASEDVIATTADVGKVLCTDGSIYPDISEAQYQQKTPVAMIAYVDMEHLEGLAIALNSVDEGYQWANAESAIENWVSTNDYELTAPNMTWKLPTKDDWQNMILGCGGSIENDKINYSDLQNKLWNCAGNYAVYLQNYYWTADEYDEDNAWSLGFHLQGYTPDYASFSPSYKTGNYHTPHACIAFNVADTVKIFATNGHVGKVLCTDGSIYATVTEAQNNKKTPAAMITYIDMVNKKGLAIALADERITYNKGTSDEYTVSTFTWSEALEKAVEHTPVIVGSNWKLPTVLEWQQMLVGCGADGTADGDNGALISYSELTAKLATAGGTELITASNYWTATENSDPDWNEYAHIMTFSDGQACFSSSFGKSNYPTVRVRACLEFDITEADPLSLVVTTADVGMVVCTDGSIYNSAYVATTDGKTPVGMIAFVDMDQETGLVIALEDKLEYNEQNNCYISARLNWSAASAAAASHSPAMPGITWRLPTIDEWRDMLVGCGDTKDPYNSNLLTYNKINEKLYNASADYLWGSTTNGNVRSGFGEYWSATVDSSMHDNIQSIYARYADFCDNVANLGYGDDLYQTKYVRACFPFNVTVKKYPITIDEDCASNVTSNRVEAAEGETVGLTITNIPEGEYVDYVNVYYHNDYDYDVPVEVTRSNYNDNVFTFTMPPYPVTVTYVGFLPIPVAQEYDGIYYTLNYRNHYAEVAPHPDHAYSGAINVPSMFMLDNRDYYVTSVGREAFANYSNNEISSVTLGGNVGIIRRDAFYNSTIASLSLGNHLSTIEQYAFRKGNYPIVIPSTVDSISNWAFKGFQGSSMSVENGNSKFSSPDNCNAIIETATNTIVAGCRNSSIPSTVTTIGLAAFDSVGLATITIPANVTTIEHGAFANNPITSVNIPATVTEIDNNPFYGCKQLASITVDANNSKFDSRNGCNAICDKTRRWIIATCKNSVIPADITGIGTYAFAYREDLNEFKVPSNISLINDNAFAYSNLWNITLADNNDLIIGRWAFAQCKELRTVKMGRGISRIDEQVLIGCPKLSNIYVNAALVPKITSTTFHIDDAGNRTTAKVHVPSASLKTYQKNNLWKLLNLVPSDAVQGVTATFESVNNTKCSAVGEGLELITEEGTIWDCSTSSATITTHGGETCLQVSSSSVTLSDCSTNGFIITDSVKRIVVRAANVTDITCEIVDISENPDVSLNQTQSVTGLTASDAFQDFALNFDDSKKYSKAKVNVTITGTSPIYVQSISIVQGGGDYVITDESSTTVQGIEYSNNMSAPTNAQDAEAIIDNVPVYVYTTCLPTAPVRDTGLKFYTLSSSTNTSLQFAEVTGALAANTPYLVAVSQDAEIGMSVENESVTLKKESDNYSLSSDGAYKFVGTTTGLTNAEAVAASAYILQDGNVWGQVTAENFEAYIPPFRAYIVPTGPSSRSMLSGGFTDATGIKTLQLTDRDGTKHYFDLNGRRISSPAASGVYVTNGKKVIIKK